MMQKSVMIAPTYNLYISYATVGTFLFLKSNYICLCLTYNNDIYVFKIYFTEIHSFIYSSYIFNKTIIKGTDLYVSAFL